MKCKDCLHFTADPEGYGGIGICALDTQRELLTIVWHKGYQETHRQQALPYPGQVACAGFEGAISKNV